jgi:hypothetical protein
MTAVLDRLSAGVMNHRRRSDETCLHCGIYFRDKCLLRQLPRWDCFFRRRGGRPRRTRN